MISHILVANRGEIAQRVIRTTRELGLKSTAIYSDTDREAPFVINADSAFALGGTSSAQTYCNIGRIIDIAQRARADAVHPGYGFLSESADFAQAVLDAGLIWIGPSPAVLAALGDKIQARRLAESVGVSPVPGISEAVADRAKVDAFVAQHGFPIATKKSDGGGGRGITVHHSAADLDRFFAAQGTTPQGFFLERFICSARHIETQCARDAHGNFAVVSTRDCSVQRRNQKLIEEAPAPELPDGVEQQLRDFSQRIFEAVDFVGLGTVEFLVEPDGQVHFLEVNPRLQVEHTVSEEVTGLDLVAEQIAIAQGSTLSEVPAPRAHSFEFRITCEDPARGLAPSTGQITKLRWPLGHGVRIESGVDESDLITANFDPMLAKLIVTGADRRQALARSKRALAELVLEGVATPVAMYADLISRPEFDGHVRSTRWFEDEVQPSYIIAGAKTPPTVEAPEPAQLQQFVIEIDGKRTTVALPERLISASAPRIDQRATQPRRGTNAHRGIAGARQQRAANGVIISPIQAIVVRIAVHEDQEVAEGDLLVVLESMKMESYVYAPAAGVVTEIHARAGDTVAASAPLMQLR